MAKMKLKSKSNSNHNTLSELIDAHLSDCKVRGLSHYTIRDYEACARIIVGYIESDTLLEDINNQLINDMILEMKKDKKPSTINNHLRYFKTLLRYGHENGMMDEVKIKMVKEQQELKQPLTDTEIKKLLKAPKEEYVEYRNWMICNVLLSTGMRSRNCRKLKVSDYNHDKATLHLQTTKNGKPQVIYLSVTLNKLIREWLELVGLNNTMPLFPSLEGKEMSRRGFSNALESYFKKRGVECSPHQLRHTFVHELLLNNTNLVVIKNLLNHQDIKTTQNYCKMLPTDLVNQVDKIDILHKYNKMKLKS